MIMRVRKRNPERLKTAGGERGKLRGAKGVETSEGNERKNPAGMAYRKAKTCDTFENAGKLGNCANKWIRAGKDTRGGGKETIEEGRKYE